MFKHILFYCYTKFKWLSQYLFTVFIQYCFNKYICFFKFWFACINVKASGHASRSISFPYLPITIWSNYYWIVFPRYPFRTGNKDWELCVFPLIGLDQLNCITMINYSGSFITIWSYFNNKIIYGNFACFRIFNVLPPLNK